MKAMFSKTKSILAIVLVVVMMFSNAALFVRADGTVCTVTFKPVLKAATDIPGSVTVLAGAKVQIPANTPECEGWAFVGWNESGEAIDPCYIPGQYITVYADMTLKAAWRASDGDGQYPTSGGYYSVYYSANGGTWAEGDDSP